MRATKHLLFIIAILGVTGAFLPFLEIRSHGVPLKLTARELSFGFEKAHKAIAYKLPAFAEARLPGDVKSTRDDIRLVASAVKFAMALYIPFGLMLIVAILSQYRGRLTRGPAAIAMVCGALSAAAWFALRYAIDYGLEEVALKRTSIELLGGAQLLLFAGAAGVALGLVGVIRPEAARVRRPPPGPGAPPAPSSFPPPPVPPPTGPAPIG